MTIRQMHLHTSGSGMAARTACGRNILRTPMSTGWEEFKTATHRCSKCEQSKTFAFLTKQDAKAAQAEADKWVPQDPDAWKIADDALIAARRARK